MTRTAHVIGAGIGGLATAAALAKRGWKTTIHERGGDLREIGRLQKGEILVCNSTDPGWTPAFGLLSGLILEAGGMLSHGACLSREYGLPAVTLPNAMQKIPDGATISVDGNTGRVTVVSELLSDAA